MTKEKQQPNVLLIMTDQHRLAGVGAYGETPCQTPIIDRLAERGVRFDTAYTTCPVCTPARASIMTGLMPHAHGMTGNPHQIGTGVSELPDHPDLLPRRLANAGYQLGYTGKWHLGTGLNSVQHEGSYIAMPNQPSLPEHFGFSGHSQPKNGKGTSCAEYETYLAEHGFRSKLRPRPPGAAQPSHNYGILEGPEEAAYSYFLADQTKQLIDTFGSRDQPFFIWHSFPGPHHPWTVPQEFYDIYRNQTIPEWPNYRDWDPRTHSGPHQMNIHPEIDRLAWSDWEEAIRHYYAYVTLIDRQIGRILDHLEATGLQDDTLVIFTADHGETLGSHGGLTNKGWTHFEEIQRVPLIIAPPVQEPQPESNRAVEEHASLVDIYPTILDYTDAGFEAACIHGQSLRPLVQGEPVEWREGVFVEFYSVFRALSTLITARKGNLKYGWNAVGPDELYDLEADPYEMQNLIDCPDYQQQAGAMRALLAEWAEQTGAVLPGWNSPSGSRIPGLLK